ncbi:ABC transporter ATP-binding protein [Vagococcus bubulae]|uniref:ABC transporter domain-containing protein n=1 Tax=Vagococcus bubulae TaxID=1977868 RepID=A0A429ZB47_9ENTE|nr:ABC transporter ATP-binding protein [Vagococcus bubulae]RST90929.1 hypothetical protein CBF36_10755 [Vagococcus bubulae]
MRGIELSELTIKRGDKEMLRQVDFGFSPHEFILLSGASGSGKSTLLKAIAGFTEIEYTGDILIDGERLNHASMSEKAKQLGMMFQNPGQQFTMKTLRREIIFVLENLQTAPNDISEQMQEAIQMVETSELLDRNLSTLSGGEKQRAALTVLLAMKSPFLLLDEPFASIDPKTRKLLIQKLHQLKKQGKTIILCDHDFNDYANVVDTWVTLDNQTLQTIPTALLKQNQSNIVLTNNTAPVNSILTLDNIRYKQNHHELLHQETFQFLKGITTLTGDNGTGKSTLFRSIAQCHPYQGKMVLYGKKLKKSRTLYQTLSLVTQEAEKQFVTLTPKEEFLYSENQWDDAKKMREEAIEYLGIESLVNRSVFHLSEGQKKSIQLLTMLSINVPFLLLDEPFTGLDERAATYFASLFKKQANRQDLLIISHRLAPLDGVSQHHVHLDKKQLWQQDYSVKEELKDVSDEKFCFGTKRTTTTFDY